MINILMIIFHLTVMHYTNPPLAEVAETVGFQLAMFIATLTLYEFLYSSIIA